MADVQTGFGSFVSFYLADLHWSKAAVGLALSAGGVAGVLCQMPGGALVDAVPGKRAVIAAGAVMVAASALILALWPTLPLVIAAEILHGATGGLIGPAIAAVSLGLVGRRAMSARVGRNFRFDAAGNALTGAALGAVAHYVSPAAMFYATAGLTIPVLAALSRIRAGEIDYALARNASDRREPRRAHRYRDLARNRALLAFAAGAVLFRFADAPLLPAVSQTIGGLALLMGALVAVPQIGVAILAPRVGSLSESWGRRPLLLVGFALEPVRALLFIFVKGAWWMIAVQLLDGVTGAIVTVLTIVVLTDLTTGTGRFNLVSGTVGMLTGIAAALSTAVLGFISQGLGETAGFLTMAAVAAAGAVVLWLWLPESRPQEYLD